MIETDEVCYSRLQIDKNWIIALNALNNLNLFL